MTDRGRKVKISLFLMIFSAVSMSFCSQAAILTTSEYDGAVVYNGHTYKVYQNGADYETAERECEERGGHLVTIADADTQNMVVDMLSGIPQDHCWIGLSDENHEGHFTWTDGTEAVYTNWGSGQPDNHDGAENHVLMNCRDIDYGEWEMSRGGWNDCNKNGDEYHDLSMVAYICEWDADMTGKADAAAEAVQEEPSEEGGELVSYDGHFYAVFDEPMTWYEAKTECERRGGYLVCINNQREQQFIQTAVIMGSSPYYWIGLTDKSSEGDFRWVNGEPLTYTNWSEKQPDNWQESEDVAMLPNRDRFYAEWENAFGTWNDMNGSGDKDHRLDEMGYICEWDSIDPDRAVVLADLLDELETTLQAHGVSARTDKTNGTITLDNAVLFEVNSYVVGNQGQEMIGKLMEALCEVFSDERFVTRIASINIQGHTDSDGTYEHNVELSANRAESVRTQCMNAISGDEAATELFSRLFATSGCSYDYPVLDDGGNEDKALSRRVVFVFYLKY